MEALTFKNLEVVPERCKKHDTPLVKLNDRVTCIVCTRERVTQEENELVKEAEARFEKRSTYDRLEMDSICDDTTLKKATFDSYVTDSPETEKNKKMARVLAARYLKGETFNTILTGNAGTGKSHLAMAMLQALNEHSKPWVSCLFLSLNEYLLDIRSTFNNQDRNSHENQQTLIDRVANVDFLVIDDLGAETGFIGTDKIATDFTQKVLYGLMNKRQDKSTIITTNLKSDQLERMYDKKVISRLYRNVQGNVISFEQSKDKRISF